jgi:predicted aspartyl protease
LVPVTIEGTAALMLLSTNTSSSTLTEAAVSRLALQTHSSSITLSTYTGKTFVPKIATAKAFSIGSAHFKPIDFMVVSLATSSMSITAQRDYSNQQVIGIIGMDVLSNADLELDIASHKMNLYSQDHCPNSVVYWSHVYDSVPIHLDRRGEFYFPMELDGKKIEATLSTFQSMTTLSTDVTKKLYNFDSHSPDVESETDSAGKTITHYRSMQIDAIGFKIVNAHITLIDPRTNCHLGTRFGAAAYDNCIGSFPLMLGLNVLTKLHIYLATKEKVLYLTSAEVVSQR